MDKPFGMEIYRPTSRTEGLAYFESDMPLMVPRVGEHINPVGLEGADSNDVFEVVHVEHLFSHDRGSGGTKQKAMVYTKRVPAAKGATWGRS